MATPSANEIEDPSLLTLAKSGCISECLHKETIVQYTFAEPIGLDLVESLAPAGELYLDRETGIFKIVKVDHFYIFGVLGDRELRICMYFFNKISDRLKIDQHLIEHFQRLRAARGLDEDVLQLRFNKTGSLARVAIPIEAAQGVSVATY